MRNIVITSVKPLRLFGQQVPGLLVAKSLDYTAGLIKDGPVRKVISVGNTLGGNLAAIGLTSRELKKKLR